MNFAIKLYQKIKFYRNKTAISYGKEKVTYKILNEVSQKIARFIFEFDNKSNVVGIVGQRNFSVYYGILGSIYSGTTYVPINNKYTTDRIIKIIKEANINILIGNKDSIYSIKDAINPTDIKCILFPEEDFNENKNNFFGKIKIFSKADLISLQLLLPIKVKSNHIFYILFTSGSTGYPKGVMVSDENVDTFIENINKFYDFNVGYKSSQTFDLGFDPSIVDMFLTWINGGQLCILSQSELIMPYDYLKREKINFWYSVPTLVKFMIKMGYLVPNSFPDLKYSIFTGEALPQDLCDAWQIAAPNSTIENGYGPTEATVNISRFVYKNKDRSREFSNNILPIGTIYKGHQFAIIDESLNKLKKGAKGHLVVKGKQIVSGYLNNEEKTNTSFIKMDWDKTNQKWYLTGDLAFINDFDEIEYLGRIDDQIKIAGRRVEIGEIESALIKTNKIKDIIIVPKKDSDGIVISLIGFTTSKISNEDKTSINKSALKFIEKLFLPSKIIIIDKIPINTSGKTDRKKLFELAKDL